MVGSFCGRHDRLGRKKERLEHGIFRPRSRTVIDIYKIGRT